jgi:LmbE family N-acetylglucosaminyl deacetylase
MGVAAVDNVNDIKTSSATDIEGWTQKKKILVILAHPDDPEFFCGAMIARWCSLGHEVRYCLLTTGQKGSQDPTKTTAKISEIRKFEQQRAADLLGVKSAQFFDYVDGELQPDIEMRKKIVRIVRQFRPQIVVTSDPQNFFPGENRINHADHRAAGQVVAEAVFPAAGNVHYFPELLYDENLKPANIEELWISATSQPNLIVDMTDYFEKKMEAIFCHKSQIGDADPIHPRSKNRKIIFP